MGLKRVSLAQSVDRLRFPKGTENPKVRGFPSVEDSKCPAIHLPDRWIKAFEFLQLCHRKIPTGETLNVLEDPLPVRGSQGIEVSLGTAGVSDVTADGNVFPQDIPRG